MSKWDYLRNWWNAKYYLRREKVWEAHQHREAVALGFFILGAITFLLAFVFESVYSSIDSFWFWVVAAAVVWSLALLFLTISSHKISDTRVRTETYVWNELLEPGPTRLDEEE